MPKFTAQITGPDIEEAARRLRDASGAAGSVQPEERTKQDEGGTPGSSSLSVVVEAKDADEARRLVLGELAEGYSAQVSARAD